MLAQEIVLIGVPMEDGAGRPGCCMGPDAFRTAGLQKELRQLGHSVRDLGNLRPDAVSSLTCENPKVRHLESMAGWTRAIFKCSSSLGRDPVFPIFMGGDHALAAGSVSGLADAAAEADRPLFVLWLDAHADFNTLETTESGNLHGTPLAFLCGLPGFSSYLGHSLKHWVRPENVEIIGLRSVDPEERKLVVKHGVGVSDMRSIDEEGIGAPLKRFLNKVAKHNGRLHVSLDVDFLDPEIAPAVGTTVPGGATFREAHLLMEMLHDSGLVTSLDLVELNPFLDERGRTARLMVDLVASLFGRRVFDRPTRSY